MPPKTPPPPAIVQNPALDPTYLGTRSVLSNGVNAGPKILNTGNPYIDGAADAGVYNASQKLAGALVGGSDSQSAPQSGPSIGERFSNWLHQTFNSNASPDQPNSPSNIQRSNYTPAEQTADQPHDRLIARILRGQQNVIHSRDEILNGGGHAIEDRQNNMILVADKTPDGKQGEIKLYKEGERGQYKMVDYNHIAQTEANDGRGVVMDYEDPATGKKFQAAAQFKGNSVSMMQIAQGSGDGRYRATAKAENMELKGLAVPAEHKSPEIPKAGQRSPVETAARYGTPTTEAPPVHNAQDALTRHYERTQAEIDNVNLSNAGDVRQALETQAANFVPQSDQQRKYQTEYMGKLQQGHLEGADLVAATNAFHQSIIQDMNTQGRIPEGANFDHLRGLNDINLNYANLKDINPGLMSTQPQAAPAQGGILQTVENWFRPKAATPS